MIYRNVTNLTTALVAAAIFAVASSGTPVVAQQYSSSGCSTCSGCYQTVNFPPSNVSSMPLTASDLTYPAGQVVYSSASTQSLPTTTSFVGSTASSVVYPNVVNETSNSYPAATYATGATIVSNGTVSEPMGTLTSIPAASSMAPVTPTYSQPVYVQPKYTQPTYTQPVYYPSTRSTPIRSTLSTGYQAVSNGVGAVSSGLAQRKAQQAASGGVRGHIGGGLGGARYEGVGWSSQSPQAAIQQCCYWGTRPTAQIGVSRGKDGLWYACVLYK
jgi:hypothetical protein